MFRGQEASGMSSASAEGIRSALASFWARLAGTVSHLIVHKHYDATPLQFAFGNLQPQLVQVAQYAVAKDDGYEWVDWSEYRRRHPAVRSSFGRLEFFMQTVRLDWCKQDAEDYESCDLPVMPQI
eukprot:434739-Amphidinium_carterae.3